MRDRKPLRGTLVGAFLGLVCLGAVVFLLASGSSSIASEPGSPEGAVERAGLGSEVVITGWVVVFMALSALYSFERRNRTKLIVTARDVGAPALAQTGPRHVRANRTEVRPATAGRRPIELLLKKKPTAAAAERPPPPVIAAPKLNLPEQSTLLRRPTRGVTESGEESFSVVDVCDPEPTPAPAPPAAPAPAAGPEPTPVAALSVVSEPSRPERCAALRAEGRFAEAARVAREGLAGDDDPGPLLIELSRAELGLGRANAAIDTARDAHFVCRSRESISHLMRLLIEMRRFGREDGAMLRRAAARHPEQPLLRHAAGVFESMYGDAAAAERELREALRLEADAEPRAAIERDLARLRAAAARAGTQPARSD